MSKQEFIDRLRTALNGKIPATKVEETASYYQDYINTEIRKGKSEEEVLQSLGDPRLIARTIIQTSGSENSGVGGEYEYDAGGHNSQGGFGSTQGEYHEFRMGGPLGFLQRMPRWLVAVLVIVIVLVVLSIVFSILASLAPVIIVMLIVIFFVKLFRDWLN
ncbi:MAG: DUF1700 domain-containing protein [Lachnospiraceae bacterium]|nr:DUF1700 domain-containing protein [Lachnospiraceae bacterium]